MDNDESPIITKSRLLTKPTSRPPWYAQT